MDQARYTIFEVVNEKLKEIFVGATAVPMLETIQHLRNSPPAALARWNLDDLDTFRSIESDLDQASALGFIKEYAKEALPIGWRLLSEPLPFVGDGL